MTRDSTPTARSCRPRPRAPSARRSRATFVKQRASVRRPIRARSIELYRTLLDRQPGFAETHYRLGLLLDHAGAWDEAYRHYVAARDLDGLPMRCLSSFQQVYRDVAAKQQCILVDGQELFHAIGPHGLLDDHLFHDAMHPSLLGHIALAQGIVDALRARRAFGWPAGAPQQAIDPVRCALHFGLQPKDWKPVCERGAMFYYATLGLRYDRTQRLAKQEAFKAAAQPDTPQGVPPRQPACLPIEDICEPHRFGPVSIHAPVTVVLAIPNYLGKCGSEREQR